MKIGRTTAEDLKSLHPKSCFKRTVENIRTTEFNRKRITINISQKSDDHTAICHFAKD